MQKNTWPAAEWQQADAAVLNMNADILLKLDSVIQAEYENITGIVVVRNGQIAFENYYHGCGPSDAQHVASVTKSVLSALIGIAIDRGFIQSVDQKVLDFFPEYSPAGDEAQQREITLRHLLTMTVPYPFEDWREPLDQLCMQPDWIKYTLDGLGQNGRIGDFKYATRGAHLLSGILTRCTGMNARAFANQYLFAPCGMRQIPDYEMEAFGFDELFGSKLRGWVKDPQGNSTGGWGLTLTARDMARFGLLYLNGGLWQDKRILSQTWINESTQMNANHYGYLWWLREEGGFPLYMALGDGGNAIVCLPHQDLLVTITSAFKPDPRDRWTLIKEHILPAILD